MADSEDWQRRFTDQAKRHGRFYYRVALRMLGDATAAEDACQRALLQTWQKREDIAQAEALGAYLTQTVVNESLQLRRRRQTERAALGRVEPARDDGEPPGTEMERQERVWQALSELHEPTRTIVILRVMHGLTGREVRDRLNCSASEVSRRLQDGLKRLHGILAPQETGHSR